MTKGTTSQGPKNHRLHKICPRCGKHSQNIQTNVCASCGYPSSTMRKYNWTKKATNRRHQGVGRMSHIKTIQRKFSAGTLN